MATPTIISLTLINADTDKDIGDLLNGAVLDLASLPTKNLNIRANTNPATIGSVKFALSGPQVQNLTESTAPYALFGDTNSNFNQWTPPLGKYVLKATPYPFGGGAGPAGSTVTVGFTVVNDVVVQPKPAAPAPSAPVVVSKPAPAPALPVAPTVALLKANTTTATLNLPTGYTLKNLQIARDADMTEFTALPNAYPDVTQDANGAFTVPLAALAQGIRIAATSTAQAGQLTKLPPLTPQVKGGLYIFDAPDYEVLPGDEVELWVHPGVFQVVIEAPNQPITALKIQSQGPYTRTVIIPGGYLQAEWKLYLRKGLNLSAPIYLNRPRIKGTRSDEVLGGCPYAFHGAPLFFTNATPRLRFKDEVTNTYYPATIDTSKSHLYGIEATTTTTGLPDSLAEKQLTPYFSTGLPGATEVALPPVTVVTRTGDPMGIGHAYVHRIPNVVVNVPINSADVTAATRTAYGQLGAAGGYVQWTAGTSGTEAHVTTTTGSDSCLEPSGRVIFCGAPGAGISVAYGKTGDTVSTYPALVYWKGDAGGFANVVIKNYNDQGKFFRVQGFAKSQSRYILHNVTMDVAGTEGFVFSGKDFSVTPAKSFTFDRIHLTGTTIANRYASTYKQAFGPVTLTNFKHFSAEGSYFTNAIGQCSFNDGENLWIANSTFERDATNYAGIVAGGGDRQGRNLSVDFARGVYLWNNRLFTTGTAGSVTDGEGYLLSEGGGPSQRANGYAQVVSNSDKTMTIGSAAFLTNMTQYGVGACVFIINGLGTGQYRTITAYSGTSITYDRPFDVAPDSTSTIAINNYALIDATVGGGTMTDIRGACVSLYRSLSMNVVIADITTLRSEGVQAELGQIARTGFYQHSLTKNLYIKNITMDNGQQKVVASYVCLTTMADAYQISVANGGGPVRGTAYFGYQLRKVRITQNNDTAFQFPVVANGSNYNQFGREGVVIGIKNNNDNPTPTTLPTRVTEGGIVRDCVARNLWTNEASQYTVLVNNTFTTLSNLAVGNQSPAQNTTTLAGNEVPTEAIM